ncbi:MAG TPA: hypothetical protein VKR29_13600 [Candidatus Binataceae bacterium]|nr:hypothetical protein [Candidatus Binataceae bacterium]
MSQPKSELKTSILALAEVALIDLPAAVTLRAFKAETDGELPKAGWKAYEAATGIVTDLTNRAYANKGIAKVGARMLENTMRTQRVVDAMAGAFFSALWPSLGLPMASDIEALRRDVKSLREEVRAIAYEQDETEDVRSEAEVARETAIRKAAVGAHVHQNFDNASWVGWRALPAMEVRNRVRS